MVVYHLLFADHIRVRLTLALVDFNIFWIICENYAAAEHEIAFNCNKKVTTATSFHSTKKAVTVISVAVSFITIMGQMTEMSQWKKNRYQPTPTPWCAVRKYFCALLFYFDSRYMDLVPATNE